jgi:rhodanese-related sulfurtransferase
MWKYLLLFVLWTISTSLTLRSVNNFRLALPKHSESVYRSSGFDDITMEDAELLLERLDQGTIIDLRNEDERENKRHKRSEGARYLYDNLQEGSTLKYHPLIFSQRFWGRIEEEVSFFTRLRGMTISTSGKYQAILAKKLEEGGLGLLYEVILDTAEREIGAVLDEIIDNTMSERPVVFHCAKGKDRTGIIAAILQLGLAQSTEAYSKEEIISEYCLSEGKLDEKEGDGASGNGIIDWRKLRGAPSSAVVQMLSVIEKKGGFDGYVRRTGVDPYFIKMKLQDL